MKTRKTLKKRRTSKKYNKTKFRRFNKYNNLTSKMKGGGGFLEMFSRSLPKYYSDWIDKLEQLKTDLTGDTTYTWLYPAYLREWRLQYIETALKQFRKKKDIEEVYKSLFNYLIEKYNERKEDSKINTENSQQISQEIANAKNLLSIIFEHRIFSKNWLEKYIEHLRSDNSGLTASEKNIVQQVLQLFNNNDAMNSEQVYQKWQTIKPERDYDIRVQEYERKLARHAEHEVEQEHEVEDEVEQEDEEQAEQQEEQEQEAKPENSSRISTMFDTFTSRFRGSTVPVPAVVTQKMPRLGAISRPPAVSALNIRKNGGKSKHTFKRKVKNKKRRR